MVTPSFVVIVTIFLFSSPLESNAHALCVGQEATALALVGLHEGPNCTQVSLRGIQQQAAILAAAQAADNVLSKDGMNFRVKVFDTCSDPREAVSATLRALAALPHACLQPPLLLGFVGPEDGASLEAVQKVTKVFNLNHAVPFRLDSTTSNNKQGPLHVTSINTGDQLQSMIQLVTKLQWNRVTLLHTSDAVTIQLASALARRLCVVGSPLALPEDNASAEDYSSIMNTLAIEQDSPVVIMAGSTRPVVQFLSRTEQSPPAYLIAASTAGLLPELSTMVIPAPVVVLQYTSVKQSFSSDMWDRYKQQHHLPANADIQSLMADIQDPSVTPMANAVALYGSALSVVRQARCQGRSGVCSTLSAISPDQWRNLLSVAMATPPTVSKKIRFRMETPTKADIFMKLSAAERILKIGHVESGKLDIDSDDLALLPSLGNEDINTTDTTACWNGQTPVVKPTTKSSTAPEPEVIPSNDNSEDVQTDTTSSVSDEDMNYYEMIAYLSGISAGIFIIFLIGLIIVVRSFIPQKRKVSPPSSVSSVRTRD